MLGDLNGRLEHGADGILVDIGAEFIEEIDGEPVRTVLTRAAVENHQLSLAFHSRASIASWAAQRIATLRFASV